MRAGPENTGIRLALGAVLVAWATTPAAGGQTENGIGAGPRTILSSGGLAPVLSAASGEVVREIDDPHTGDRWLLLRDPSHPGGPGRLVLADGMRNQGRREELGGAPLTVTLRPAIRAGDRLVVEERTAVAEARLEAVALGPAAIGSPFEARLKIGGKVVRAVALAAGRAAFLREGGVRP